MGVTRVLNNIYRTMGEHLPKSMLYRPYTPLCQASLSKGIYKVTDNFASLKWSKFPQTFHIYLLKLPSNLEIFRRAIHQITTDLDC